MKKRNHGTVVYIDPITGLQKCSPNQCKNKLIEHTEIVETNYKWIGGPVKHFFYYFICKDCKSRTITAANKSKTFLSYKRAITNGKGKDPFIEEVNLNDSK
jgi:hypothetical protein